MNDRKVFEGDISEALDGGWHIVADFGEDPNGKHYCIVTPSYGNKPDKTPSELAAEFQAMKHKIKELESDQKQARLF
ncbi:MAG TPA: hypothetical protein VJ248_09750 [Candidatus Udaeobacter sp.]|nr:hypothetical protein [Candidatus Udaeobacter sp.]